MRIYLSPPQQTGKELDYLRQALETNYLAPAGPLLDELEARIRALTGAGHALALQSGTAALHLAYRHLLDVRHRSGCPFRPLVIASSLSFIASVAPAVQSGCDVWLVDAEPESWTLDPLLLSRALSDARLEGRPVLCVVPTDLYGQRCDLSALSGLCSPAGIPILSDSAEALGAAVPSSTPRPWATVFSLNGNKIITASSGGLLVSDDGELIAHARKLSQQAREPAAHYEHCELGYNYRMSHLLAGVALAQMDLLDERVRKRRRITEWYRERLESVPGIQFMPEAVWNRCTRWLTVIQIHADTFGATPGEIREALEAEDIESRPVWKPLHLQPALRGLRMYDLGVSARLFAEGLCLPSGGAMTEGDVDRVCRVLLACGDGV